jgi:peptidoglycan/xylan/chitin deacetylase (PgdA/CDA1 family)
VGNRAPIHITFDDGHRSNYEQAFPLLEEFRVKATFFLLADHIGTDSKFIGWAHAREMSAAGHRIESHGLAHRVLTACTKAELREEVLRSKQEIEDHLGLEVDSISAPGGRWNQSVLGACTEVGYKYFFHSNPWTSGSGPSGIRLKGRHMVTNVMGVQRIQTLVEAHWMRRMFWRATYGAKERLRQTLGDALYHNTWCWLANWTPEDGLEVQVSGVSNKKDIPT